METDNLLTHWVFMRESCITNGVQTGTCSEQLRALKVSRFELSTASRATVALIHIVDPGNRSLLLRLTRIPQ
jgi:hypothetical protein